MKKEIIAEFENLKYPKLFIGFMCVWFVVFIGISLLFYGHYLSQSERIKIMNENSFISGKRQEWQRIQDLFYSDGLDAVTQDLLIVDKGEQLTRVIQYRFLVNGKFFCGWTGDDDFIGGTIPGDGAFEINWGQEREPVKSFKLNITKITTLEEMVRERDDVRFSSDE